MDTRDSGSDPIRIGLNGFGRIGRSIMRAAVETPGIEIVAVNDIMDDDDMRYLLAHDSVMGRLEGVELLDGELIVGNQHAKVLSERDPGSLPWEELDVDVALECTGLFRSYDDARKHLDAGANKAIISAPPSDGDVLQIVYGANHDTYSGQDVISNASCTTNSVAPVAKILHEAFGIDRGLLTTVHAYTSTQELVDGPSGKRRRGRAAAENIIPTTTGAAKATTEVLPELAGKLDGMSMRVPIPNGSITDLTVSLEADADAGAVNDAIRAAVAGEMAGIVGCTNEAIVSRDIVGLPYSGLVDLDATMSLDGGFVKVLIWYDNEYGFSNRLLDMAQFVITGEVTAPTADPITAP